MALEAIKRGYQYLAITDHTTLPVARGMNDKRLKEQMNQIDKINSEIDEITLLKGAEVNINSQGELDISRDILEELDMVIASVHYDLRQEPEKMYVRIRNAMENEYVNILGHPTGRKLKERAAYKLDIGKLFEEAAQTGTVLEVNSQPKRLDLKDIHVKMALQNGCKLAVNSDSHNSQDLDYMGLGVATVRRGWARKEDIINTLPLKKLLKIL